MMRRSRVFALLAALLLPSLGACGGDGPTEVDPELEPFVGFWTATALIQTSTENPDKSLDLVAEGAGFTLEIRANGEYESVLDLFGARGTETGRVEVREQELLFFPSTRPNEADPATYEFSGGRLVLEGSSNFNFPNDDEGPVPTTLRIELERQ